MDGWCRWSQLHSARTASEARTVIKEFLSKLESRSLESVAAESPVVVSAIKARGTTCAIPPSSDTCSATPCHSYSACLVLRSHWPALFWQVCWWAASRRSTVYPSLYVGLSRWPVRPVYPSKDDCSLVFCLFSLCFVCHCLWRPVGVQHKRVFQFCCSYCCVSSIVPHNQLILCHLSRRRNGLCFFVCFFPWC